MSSADRRGEAVVPKVTVQDSTGQTVGEVTLNPTVFDCEINESLMHQAVKMYLANQRVGTAMTKTRGLVRGGGRKPWRQKGTGRARAGTIRSPLWRGGGITFGPQVRDHRQKMPRKARRQALRSALTSKARAEALRVVNSLDISEPKTKQVVGLLSGLGLTGKKALLVVAELDRNAYLSARNIPGINTIRAGDLNVYSVLKHDVLVLCQDALTSIEEVLG